MSLIVTLLLTVTGAIPVEATTLDGRTVNGDLTALDARTATVEHDGQSQPIAISDLQELRLNELSTSRPPAVELRLSDGSHLAAEAIELSAREADVKTLVLGRLIIPRPLVSSIRLGKSDSKVDAAWTELIQRETRDDLIVVRKGDALDHVEGVVSGIDAESVRLLLDGNAVALSRERVFGVVLARSEPPKTAAIGHVELMNGDRLSATSVSLTSAGPPTEPDWGFTLEFASVGGFVPAADISRIDFSLGKIQYLSQVEPTNVVYPTDHELFLEDVWKYRRGENSLGDPLEIGDRAYERGLWIHSGTTLTYRLAREYRRFRAVAGIAEGIGESCNPTVGVIIRGDGKDLLNASIARGDVPREVDLDVSGVRELTIEVTSTDPDGVCEHLGLGDARVIK